MSALNFGCTGAVHSNKVEICPLISQQFDKEAEELSTCMLPVGQADSLSFSGKVTLLSK